jgi:MarR family 2-MHQ and catechol resistance regulon transcriptional repressor
MTQGTLSHKVLKSVSNMTTVVDHLERDGLACRERDDGDRRVIHIRLTAAGKKKLESVLPGHVAALVEEFEVLSEKEQQALGDLCKKLGRGREPE